MNDRYCILGRDVSHSLSPAMMNAAFRALKISAAYTRVSLPETRFAQAIGPLLAEGYKGMNVTIPYKGAIIPWLSRLDAVATRTQAVNTVKREADGRYSGHNTDPDGIVGGLGSLPAKLDVRNALLVGAGGAARAFCEAMNRIGCVDVAVAVRTPRRAEAFVQEMEKAYPKMNLTLAALDDLRRLNHDLIFNASPMGAKGEPLPKELRRIIPGTKIAFDALYLPKETRLLVAAKKAGAAVVHGEEMLLQQGMAAFKIWTGREAPEKAMRKALSGRPRAARVSRK